MWNKISVEASKTYYWNIGLNEIYLKKTGKAWLISTNTLDSTPPQSIFGIEKDAGNESKWSAYTGEKNNTLLVLPALPNRPVLVKPQNTFKVLPGKNVHFYIPIPMWLQFYAGVRKVENMFFEKQSTEQSSTWFGEPDNGTLAYSLSVDLYTALELPHAPTHHITCPVKLTNDSGELLDIQRLLVHCENLNIYSDNKTLVTNEIKIRFKGATEISDVHYGTQAPAFLESPSLVSAARNTKHQNVISKSFHFIKSLTNH